MRWRRAFAILLVLLLTAGGLVWLLRGHLVAALANSSLPRQISDQVLAEAATQGEQQAEIRIQVPRAVLAAELAAHGKRLPLWLIPDGFGVRGRWKDRDARADFAWWLSIDAVERTVIDLDLPAAWINAHLAAQSRSNPGDALSWRYALDPGTRLRPKAAPELGPQLQTWTFDLSTSGNVEATLNRGTCSARVDVLEAVITMTAVWESERWWLSGTATVTRCEHRMQRCESMMLGMMASNLTSVLEMVINEHLLRENLEEVELPTDLHGDVDLRLTLTDAALPWAVAPEDATPP